MPRLRSISFVHPALPACLAAMALAAPALAAEGKYPEFAPSAYPDEDAVVAWAEWNAGRNHFFINDDLETEVVKFRTPRDIEICAGKARTDNEGRRLAFPLKVKWDAQSAVVKPGNCMAFDAMKVAVSSVDPLPDDIILEGTYRVIK